MGKGTKSLTNDPTSPVATKSAMNRADPSDRSRNGPRIHNDHMFIPMWSMPPCMKMHVASRQYCPALTAGP